MNVNSLLDATPLELYMRTPTVVVVRVVYVP